MAARHEIMVEDFRAMSPVATGVICGIDEAGRGALAGPVVAACVCFPGAIPDGLADSKALSPKRREALFERIVAIGCVGIGIVDSSVIDRQGILPANFQAMAQALQAVRAQQQVARVIVDGNYIAPSFVQEFGPSCFLRCMVKADAHVLEVSAASIIAKVTRDRLMAELAPRFSDYGFAQNAGYPSPSHLAALKSIGPSPLHRHSFAPVAAAKRPVEPSGSGMHMRN